MKSIKTCLFTIICLTPQFVLAQITYLGSSSSPVDGGDASSSSSLSVTPPGSMQAGDLVVLVAQRRNSNGSLSLNSQGGQTWTSETQFNAANVRTRIFWCRFNGTWSGDPSVDSNAVSSPLTAVMHVFRPTDSGKLWAVDVALNNATYAAPSTPFTVTVTGVTTNNPSTVTLASWFAIDESSWGNLTGSGWTVTGSSQYRNLNGSNQSASFAHSIRTLTGTVADVSKDQATVTGIAGSTSIISFFESDPPTNTPTNTPTSTNTSTNTPTETPTVTPTRTPTSTPTVTNTPTITNTSTITNTPTVTHTATSTVTNTGTATSTPTPTISAVPSNTSTVTPTATFTPGGPSTDQDQDGIPDDVEGAADVDGDGVPNYLDLDSDGDGMFDIVESGGIDANSDGKADDLTDANNNGLIDSFDSSAGGTPLPLGDIDSDGIPNFIDAVDNRFPGCTATENLPAQTKLDKQAVKLRKLTNEALNLVAKYRCGKALTVKQKNSYKTKALAGYNAAKAAIFSGIPARYYNCAAPTAGCTVSDLTAALSVISAQSTGLSKNVSKVLFPRCSKRLPAAIKVNGKAKKVLGIIKVQSSALPNPELVCQ